MNNASRVEQALNDLNEIGQAIDRLQAAGPDNIAGILQRIVAGIAAAFPGAAVAIDSYDSGNGTDEALSPATAGATWPPVSGARLDALAAQAIAQRQPLFTPIAGGKATETHFVAHFPLILAGEPVGVLSVVRPGATPFTPLTTTLIENFAHHAVQALFRARQHTAVQQDLARREEELTRLRRAGLLISSRLRLEDTLEAILQMALEVTGAPYGIFRLVDHSGKNLVTKAVAGERPGHPVVETLPIDDSSITGWVAKKRQPVCIPDVRQPPWNRVYYPLYRDLEMRSELAVPLIGANGRLEGVLNLESPVVNGFNERDSLLLQSLAPQAVIAIQEAHLLDTVQEITEQLLTQKSSQVFQRLVELALDLLDAPVSAIWTLDGNLLRLRAASAGYQRGDQLALHDSLTGQALLTRAPVTVPDVSADPRFRHPDLARAQGWRQALIVPLLEEKAGEPVGAFSVYGNDDQSEHLLSSDWDKKVLTILAHYAALAEQNSARREALRIAQEQRAVAETFAAVGDVAANLLHHLNNKVGTIPVRVEGIQDKYPQLLQAHPYLASNLQEIEQSAGEAMHAVSESLSLLRPIHLAPVDVARCVRAAADALNAPASLTVQMDNLENLPPVMAGEQSLRLVFANLLENAAAAMAQTGRIRIRGEAHGHTVTIAVQDDGPGIPPALHERIFEFRFSGANVARQSKLGFGLWWVKTLMARLNGAISVESDGRHGSTFRLQLPQAESEP